MGCVDISQSAKVWEVLYASAFLEGKEREDALRQLQIEATPRCEKQSA